jgi:hypothetical protein
MCEHWWKFQGLDWRRCYFCGERQQKLFSLFGGPWITVERGKLHINYIAR